MGDGNAGRMVAVGARAASRWRRRQKKKKKKAKKKKKKKTKKKKKKKKKQNDVSINKQETGPSEKVRELYANMAPGVDSWLDPNNNRAFHAGEVSITNNAHQH